MTLVEPTGYSTDWAGPSARHSEPLKAYAELHEQVQAQRGRRRPRPGDPEATRAAILQVVDADQPPLRIFFGDGPLAIAEARLRVSGWPPGASGSRCRSRPTARRPRRRDSATSPAPTVPTA